MVDCCWFSLAARVSAAAAVAAQAKACISEFCRGIKEALDINSSYLNRTHPNQVRQLLLFQSIASNNTFSLVIYGCGVRAPSSFNARWLENM